MPPAPAGPPTEGDAALLTPSLTAADDAIGFDRPWRPFSLVMLVFFAGPIFGGLLAARNFVRLGQPERFAPAMAVFIVVGLAIVGVQVALASGDDGVPQARTGSSVAGDRTVEPRLTTEEEIARGLVAARSRDRSIDPDAARLRRLWYRLAALIPALFVAKAQQRRFRVFEGAGGEPAPLLKLGLAMFGLSILGQVLLVTVAAALWETLFER